MHTSLNWFSEQFFVYIKHSGRSNKNYFYNGRSLFIDEKYGLITAINKILRIQFICITQYRFLLNLNTAAIRPPDIGLSSFNLYP